jgi:uncharacterized protein (TIGR02266 family)
MAPTWERRSSQRLDVQVHVVEKSDDAVYFHRTSNLSTGGMFLDGTLPHPPGTKVRLSFALPGRTEPIEAVAEIMPPGKEQGMGVRFIEMSEPDRDRLTGFIVDVIGLPFGRSE